MSESEPLSPRDQAERVALFRAELIGAVSRRELSRGELAAALRALAAERYLPPGSKTLRYFGVSTFERWLYAYRAHGLAGLRPAPRSDRGRARDLTPEQRELLLEIRREHPTASVPLILRTLVADGRLAAGVVSDTTVARLYRDAGLERGVVVDGHTRLRWQADHAGALWHGDVCHGPTLRIGKTTRPLRIHAMLDDASRFVVALEALHSEREADMLDLLLAALRRHGAPDAIYLDNGSTYRGEALRLCCERLGITLIHARPYDAPARGKMERFWRTLRAGCIDHLGAAMSLHDVQVRLAAFVDEHYHRAPHGGLYGKTPADAWAGATCRAIDEPALAAALTIHRRRRVRKDGTVDLDGQVWQLDQGFLAGRVVTVVAAHAGLAGEPVALHDGHRYPTPARRSGRRLAHATHPARRGPAALDPVRPRRRAARQGRWPSPPSPQGPVMTYLDALGLKEPPFSKEIADADLWLPTSKRAIADGLLDALTERASVVIVGEPGVGKTCILRAARHLVAAAGYRMTYSHNATLGRRDFYRQLCLALGLAPAATAGNFFYAVSSHVEDLARERVHPVFFLDEAHLLHQDTLDHLHILLNYQWDSRALLSLVLVGLPELRDRLALRRNRSLYSRIHHRFEIEPLVPEDTAEYLRLRLQRAGCERELFASDAIGLLHEATLGAMRDIDRLAAAALRETAKKKRKLVERDVVARVIEADNRER